ncbi:Arc family DNA-binding protein [Aeromonas rivipollensis]|uniref:Arc family DNA-binding protein n=1 Tax=Aeromonas rivipollensis TaxID=948519 RepID=UPI00259FC456|nr:Arc family DNA-binding protein [Aeromonas rivipollensis]MDM5083758.1 Arc family DNA-binding protein [Aeromonas rivipollensis]MDM5096136.1 Arc family DNA-binding protein [Aeromonas rivipollensis]MDM5104311.1 Arc family DNA-binding protein [Aeromonas rivipollensis]
MSQPKPYPLRMSDEMRGFLQEQADKSGRSLNAEIVKRLQFTIDEEIDIADGSGFTVLEGLRIGRSASTLPTGTILTPHEIYKDDLRYSHDSLSEQLRDMRELLENIRKEMKEKN